MRRSVHSRAPSSRSSMAARRSARMSCARSAARSSSPSADPPRAQAEQQQSFSVQNRRASMGRRNGDQLMRKSVLLLAVAAAALTPAAAQQARYLVPRDVAEAQREHASVVEQLGGAETGQRAAYVQNVGRRIGAFSGVASP